MAVVVQNGHTSHEKAYVIADYPFGYRLRCIKRVWIEKNKRGYRMHEQTTKKGFNANWRPNGMTEEEKALQIQAAMQNGAVWNAAKSSVYYDLMILYINDTEEAGHLHHDGLSKFSTLVSLGNFERLYGSQLSPEDSKTFQALKTWIEAQNRK